MKNERNLSQFNPVAPPMAIAQNDFMAHDKTSYPFKRTDDFPKFYKIVLSSTDKVSGTNASANFLINLPTPLPKNAVLCVKDFACRFLAGSTYTCIVSIPQLLAPNSYQSSNNGASDILLTTIGSQSFSNDLQVGSVGVPITNPNFFTNKLITVNVDCLETTAESLGNWILMLYNYGYDE